MDLFKKSLSSLRVITQKFVPKEEMTDPPKKTSVITNPVFQVKQSSERKAKQLDNITFAIAK